MRRADARPPGSRKVGSARSRRSRPPYQACFRLPEAGASHAWQPAGDFDDTKHLALAKVNDRMQATGLLPIACQLFASRQPDSSDNLRGDPPVDRS